MADTAVATKPNDAQISEADMDAAAENYSKNTQSAKEIYGESPTEYAATPNHYPVLQNHPVYPYVKKPGTLSFQHRQMIDNPQDSNNPDPREYGSDESRRDRLDNGDWMSYPTIYGGTKHAAADSFAHAKKTGEHFGIYAANTPENILDDAETRLHARPIKVNGKLLNGDEWARMKGFDPEEVEMDMAAKNYGKAKPGTPNNPLQATIQFFDELNKNPIVQGLDAFEGNAIRGAGRAITLPADVALGMAGQKPVPLNIDQDKVLQQETAAHPIASSIGNFGGAAAAMMANPLYGTEALGKLLPIAPAMEAEAPVIAKMTRAAIGSLPISAAMAIQQQSMDNKGKIDWAKAAQLTATYAAANAGFAGAGQLLGQTGKKLIDAISQGLEKAQQTAPLKAAAFQQAQTGQPSGIVADILNQLGQASRRVSVGNKVVEFTDPIDAALFNANKSIASKEGRKAWKILQESGMSEEEIDTQAKLIKTGTQLLAKDAKGSSVTIPGGEAQKRAQAEEFAKQADKEAKVQEKVQKQTNAAQDKRAKELAKQADKQKKAEQDAFAKEVDEREKAIAKAEADAEKYKKSGQKEEEAKARKQLQEQQAMLDKANEAWEKAGKPEAASTKLVGETTKFSNREENWEYRHDAIPSFSKNQVPLPKRQEFNKALTQIVTKGEARLQTETDYEATQDLFREVMGIGAKTDKDIYQLERERLRANIPGLQTEKGPAHFNVLPRTRPNVSLPVANDLTKFHNQTAGGKDVRNDIASYMMKQKNKFNTAETDYKATVSKEGQKIANYMPIGTQLDHGNANVWLNEGNVKVIPGETKTSQSAAAIFKSGSLQLKQNPKTSYVYKATVESMEGHNKTAVQELKNTAAMSGNKEEMTKLDAIGKTLKGEVEGIPLGGPHDISHIVAPNMIRTAYETSKVITKTFGKVIPSKRTLFSLSSTINNLDVYTDAIPELGDYMKGTMADLNRQSMGVEFPKTPKQNDIYMSAMRKFGDDTVDDALAKGEGEFSQLPESTRNFLMYVRQKRREVLSVLKGIKSYFYGEGETYTPPTNPFSVGRNQLFHVLTSDIDQLSGLSGITGGVTGDVARNLYTATLTGKWSPHVAHIVSSLHNNTSYDPLWVLRIAQGMREGPQLYQAATAFNNRGPLRSIIDETPINRDENLGKLHKMMDDAFIKHIRNASDAIDKAVPMTDEQKQNMVNLLTGATTEQAKTTVTRMGAIARAAQKEGMTPGQGAKLLLEDMHSTQPNITALRMHYSIAQDMLNVIGSNAPGLRATTILDHMPLGKIFAPYNYQRNVNTKLTLSYIGDMGEALRRGDNLEAGQALGKLLLHTGIGTTYLGSKAIPVELSAAINLMNPKLGQQISNNLNQFAAVAQLGKVNPETKDREGRFSVTHMQPSLNPMSSTNFSWISGALSSVNTIHNYFRNFQPPKNDEEANKRNTAFVGAGLFLAALAGHTEFTKLFGSLAAYDYYKAFQKIQTGKKDVIYRTPRFGLFFGGDIVGSDKAIPTDFKDQFTHALSGGKDWHEFMKQVQLEGNEGARQNMAWFKPNEYKSIIKQQGVDIMREVLGAEDAKMFGFKKKAISDMDWTDIWNQYNSSPQARAIDELQKQPPTPPNILFPGENKQI